MIGTKWLGRVLVLCTFLCLSIGGIGQGAEPKTEIPKPDIYAKAAVLLNTTTGEILYKKKEYQQMYPGSTTKIMTYILGLELGKNRLDQPLYISENAVNIPDASMLGLAMGDRITLREAMRGMIVVSGCDAAVAVAETVTDSQSQFVRAMNQKAAALGCAGTHFTNVHGMPDSNHYTTALDLARIAAYGMSIPEFRNAVKRATYDMKYMDGHTKTVNTTNYFLTSGFEGADGVKTGTTDSAGPCVIVSATRKGTNLIGVILNSADRWSDAQALMTYGFAVVDKKNEEKKDMFEKEPTGEVIPVALPIEIKDSKKDKKETEKIEKKEKVEVKQSDEKKKTKKDLFAFLRNFKTSDVA